MKAFEWKPFWKKEKDKSKIIFRGSYFWLWVWIFVFFPLAFLYWGFKQG